MKTETVQPFQIINGHISPDKIDEILLPLAGLKPITTSKRKQYYNIVCAFDIETTSFSNQLDEKCAIMYCWQMAINGRVVFGRTWDEFIKVLNRLTEFFNLYSWRRLIMYVHNLAFEFQFIRKRLEWESVFSIETRKPLYALTTGGIEFRDSYLLSGYSLAKLGDNLQKYKVKKLVGDLDYSKIRHSKTPMTEKEIAYCENDVLVVSAYVQEEIEKAGNITRLPLTKTGYVRNYCRSKCFYGDDRHKTSTKIYQKYRELILNLHLTGDEYKQLKRAFQGGFTHAAARFSGKVEKNVDSIDFTSSYPYVLLSEQFPMSSGRLVEIHSKEEFKKYIHLYCCLFDVEFTNLTPKFINENYISLSRCYQHEKAVVNNGRVVSADKIVTTITDVDYTIIEKTYDWDSMTIYNFRVYNRGYLPTNFVKSILKLYSDKTTLKGVEGKEVEYLVSKSMLNSCYGMTVTDIVRDEITYSDEWDTEKADVESDIEHYNNSRNRFLFYPWGVWVTAYARRNLWNGILAFGDDYIYSDTDSIKCLNIEKHFDYINEYNNNVKRKLQVAANYHKIAFELFQPKTIKGIKKLIGVWDWETEKEKYTRFKTLGAKRYMIEQGGKINITVAGVNKKTVVPYLIKTYGNKIFDVFTNDLTIPKEFTGKMTHTYIDERRTGKITDYLGNTNTFDEYSSVHLENAEYSLSLSQAYIDFLKGYENYVQ